MRTSVRNLSDRLISTNCFDDVESAVGRLMKGARSYVMSYDSVVTGNTPVPSVSDFAPFGLYSAAARIGYPCQGLAVLRDKGYEDIADDIIQKFTLEYLNKGRSIYVREFGDEVYGYLSSKYSTFDDDKVIDIVKGSTVLNNTEDIWYSANPVHFHARFIDKEQFTVGNDDSPLSMAVFVDNSMVGASAFKIRFGIYRHACTNGCIWGLKEFTLIRERHQGTKDWQLIMSQAMSEAAEMKELIRRRIELMQGAKSAVYGLEEDKALAYLKTRLSASEKVATKILDFYKHTYGGETRWDLCNAITEAAHDLSLENRLAFETKALSVA